MGHTSQHTLLSITLRMSMVRLHTDMLSPDRLNPKLEMPTVMLPDHTTTSTQRERESRSPTPPELEDSRSTQMTCQLLQLLTSSRPQLQSTLEWLLSQSRTPPK